MRLHALATATVLALALALPGGAHAQTAPPESAETPKLELSVEQRQLIYTSLTSKTHLSTAAPPNFLPALGATVPAGIELLPIPETALELVPMLRGYACALVANQVLIVDPKSQKVIEIIGAVSEPRHPPSPS